MAHWRTGTAGHTPPATASTGRQRWTVLIAAVLGTALAYMSDDMLNIAVPSVARDLEATASEVQWILAYYIPLVAFVLVAGSLGDIFGHRRVFTLGLGLFCSGALVCATAADAPSLMGGRALQGVAAAMLLASGLALVTCANPGEQRDPALGQFFGLVAAVPALGPFLSGWLVDWLTWRWLFIAPLVLPLAAMVITGRLDETQRAQGRRPDLPGSFALLVSLCAVSLGLILGPAQESIAPALVWAAVGGAALAWFVRLERRAPDPLLPLALFRQRRFVGANAVWLVGCMTSWGAMFFLSVTLQLSLGLRPLAAGLLLTPVYVVMMVGSPLAGWAAARLGSLVVIVAGLTGYVVGLWLLSGVSRASPLPWGVLAPLALFAVGMATFTAPLAAAGMRALPETDQGIASGVNNAAGQLAGLLAIIVLPTLAGLEGTHSFDGATLAETYPRALQAAALLAAITIPVAVWALRGGPPSHGDRLAAGAVGRKP